MSSKTVKDQEPISHQALLDENRALKAENHALKAEIENLKALLEDEELKRPASEGGFECRRAEETAHLSEEHYQRLFNSIDEGFCIIEKVEDKMGRPLDFLFLEANPAFAEQSGVSDVVGKTIRQAFPEENEEWINTYGTVLRTGEPIRFERCFVSQERMLELYAFRIEDGMNRHVAVIFKNITERKRMEEELQHAYARLRAVFDRKIDGIGIVIVNADGNVLEANDYYLRILGFSREELEAGVIRWLEATPPEWLSMDEKAISEFRKYGVCTPYEKEYIRKDGSRIPVLIAGSIFPGDGEEILGFVLDITEHKRAEVALHQAYKELQMQSKELEAQARELRKSNEALSESEKKYRLIFDNSMDAIILTDPRGAGKVLSANPATYRMLGCSEKELIGKMRYSVFGPESPVVSAFLDERALSGLAKVQITYRRKDGTTLIGELSSTLFTDINGEPRSVTIIRDITERKAVELELSYQREVLQRIFDNIPILLVIWDPHLEQFTLNHYAEQVLGWTTADANDGDFMTKVYPDDIYRARVSAYMLSLATGWREWICTTKDGQNVPIDWANIFLTDNTMIGIGVDLRERKLAEEALRESERRFKILSEANSLLLSSKNPETMIQTIAEKVLHHLNCDVFFNYVFDKVSGRLHLNAYYGISVEVAKEIEWLDEGVSICGCVARDGYRIVSEDVQHNGDNRADLVRSLGIQAYACHPLHVGEKAVGTLSFGTRTRKGFTENELALMSTVADQVSVGIERKRAEEKLLQALKKAEEGDRLLAALMENVPEGITIADAFGRLRMVSRTGEELLGGVHIEKSIDEVVAQWTVYQPDGTTPMDTDDLPLTLAIQKGEVVRDAELVQVNTHGKKLSLLCNAAPIRDARGNVTGGIVAWHDISERKKTEEALKKTRETLEEKVKERTAELEEAYNSLLENEMRLNEAQKIAHLGNWDWNLLADKFYWSDEIYRIFKVDPLEFGTTYNSFLNYVHPDDREYVDNCIKEALSGKLFNIDYRVVLANGEKRIVHAQAEVIFDDKRTPVRMKGILQDITERKKAEEALERMDKIRIKEIHHRIKNNLQVISSLLDLQAEKFDEEMVREAFREGQSRVISMSLLHEELYKGGGTNTLDFPAYLKKLAENLFRTYSLNSKSIHLSMDLEENAFLDMDTAVPLGMIVNELVSNSLKHAFTEKPEGEVQIKLCREEKNSETHESSFSLIISDNGKGIPENIELRDVESLGLQLVSILVDQLDGEIELKREHGTEFRITFNVDETGLL